MPLKHGHSLGGNCSGVYRSWRGMFQRCENESDRAYKNYGGRGIKVAPEWRSFARFLLDMGEKPAGMSLDRIDNDGDYCKANCRWATPLEQASNRRTTVLLEHQGKRMCVTQWAHALGLSESTIRLRLLSGWPIEKCLTPEKRPK